MANLISLTPKQAAHNCINSGISVDVVLIDLTDEGVEIAKAIVRITEGQWEPVTSAEEMLQQTSEAANRFAKELTQAEKVLRQADEEFATLQKQHDAQLQVSFTAGYPGKIESNQKYPLLVYVHLSSLLDEIRKLLNKRFAPMGLPLASSTSQATTAIQRGQLLTIQPNIQHIFVNPPRQEIVWTEDYHKLEFLMHYAGSESSGSALRASRDRG